MNAGSQENPTILTILVGGTWVALAWWQSDVTFHLAPMLVALAYPYGRWRSRDPHRLRRRMVDAAVGGVAAVGITVLLDLAGWLQGPALVGGTAAGEAYLLSGVGTALALATGLWVTRST